MRDVTETDPIVRLDGISVNSQQDPSPIVTDTISQSSMNPPAAQRTTLETNNNHVTGTSLRSVPVHELTPPSSVASSQEQGDCDGPIIEDNHVGGVQMNQGISGKKRTANGQVKEVSIGRDVSGTSTGPIHARNVSMLSQTSNGSLGELSQQLRTKLAYAMVKVQHGWQKHSLDEIESIATLSPRSNLSGFVTKDFQSLVSPRTALAANMRQNSDTSTSSEQSSVAQQSPLAAMVHHDPIATSPRKVLAPPAPILAGSRRRQAPNMHLHINSSLKPSSKSLRPTSNQRTPSQNAAMEADAVETLLFMSASPSNSGHFPSHLSAYSPTSQAFSTQTSPLKTQFSPHDQRLPMNTIGYNSQRSSRRIRYEDKAALIDRLLNDLDEDESEELDRAMKIVEQHRASKLPT